MIKKMNTRLAVFALLFFVAQANAQTSMIESPFVIALINGSAIAKIDDSPMMQFAANKIKDKTGNKGEVTMKVERVVRFTKQVKCGRVSFSLYQQSTNTVWGQFGGQINICEDGTPPMRVCKVDPNKLVPASGFCKDSSRPVDTQEIAAAIADAKAKGGFDAEQYRSRMLNKTVPPSEKRKD